MRIFLLALFVSACGPHESSEIKLTQGELQKSYNEKYSEKIIAQYRNSESAFARVARGEKVTGVTQDDTPLFGLMSKKKCDVARGSFVRLLKKESEKRESQMVLLADSSNAKVQMWLKCPLNQSKILAKSFDALCASSVSATLEGEWVYARVEVTETPKTLAENDCPQGSVGKIWVVNCLSEIQNVYWRL